MERLYFWQSLFSFYESHPINKKGTSDIVKRNKTHPKAPCSMLLQRFSYSESTCTTLPGNRWMKRRFHDDKDSLKHLYQRTSKKTNQELLTRFSYCESKKIKKDYFFFDPRGIHMKSTPVERQNGPVQDSPVRQIHGIYFNGDWGIILILETKNQNKEILS